jgi:hypothetical protein
LCRLERKARPTKYSALRNRPGADPALCMRTLLHQIIVSQLPLSFLEVGSRHPLFIHGVCHHAPLPPGPMPVRTQLPLFVLRFRAQCVCFRHRPFLKRRLNPCEWLFASLCNSRPKRAFWCGLLPWFHSGMTATEDLSRDDGETVVFLGGGE